MSNFLMGLLLVNALLAAYQFSFLDDSGEETSTARATRIATGLPISHLLLTLLAPLLWIGWKAFEDTAFAWCTFAVLAVASGLELLVARAAAMPQVAGDSPDPADHVTAESRIPESLRAVLPLATMVATVLTLLVALGVFG